MRSIIILFVVFSLFGFACNQAPKKAETQTEKLYNKWINKELTLPSYSAKDTSCINCPENLFKKAQKSNFKIVSVFDIGCSTCLETIEGWRKLKDKLGPNTPILFIIRPEVTSLFTRMNKENFFEGFSVYLDEKDSFVGNNNILAKHNFETLLLNSNNQIEVIGNPTKNPSIEELYIKVVKPN